ncbi:MAG: hypothetical protein IPM13_08810 [Phycisphaerales bacterium]|nr:hypothetical protein [Phycisphaerales bacterium]
MNARWLSMQRRLVALSLGGTTLGIFGASGPCNYANFLDYQKLFTSAGNATIQAVSDSTFGGNGKDFDTIVRLPLTELLKGIWTNFVDTRVPDDLPNNPIVKR